MPDYQQGKIYKITADETDKVYIGSTTKKTLAQRMSKHRSEYKRWKDGKGDRLTSYDILDYPSAVIILIELFPCNSKDELTARERYHIENTECVNKVRYLNRTVQDAQEYAQKYRNVHQDQIKEYKKEYHIMNYERLKPYYQEYRKNHDIEIRQRKNEKVICECGVISSRSNLSTHKKNDKHIKLMGVKPKELELPVLTNDDIAIIDEFIKTL